MPRTAETLRQILTIDRAVYRAFRASCLRHLQELNHAHSMTVQSGAKATAEVLVHEIGRAEANAIVASLVNRAGNDERYSKPVKEWAKGVELANDAGASAMLGISTDKVPVDRLNEIAQALMNHHRK